MSFIAHSFGEYTIPMNTFVLKWAKSCSIIHAGQFMFDKSII